MSDQDNWPANPSDTQAAPKSSSSGCLKWFLILGGLGLFCMLLCCGVAGWFGSKFIPKLTTNPAEVAEVWQKIMKIDVPEGFTGESAATIDNSYMTFQMAKFKGKTDDCYLQLGKIEIKFADMGKMNKQQQNEIMDKYQNPDDKANQLEITKTETKEFVIDGKKVPFRFSEAVASETETEVRVVEAELGTAGNMRFLKFVIEAEDYDEDAVVKMMSSTV